MVKLPKLTKETRSIEAGVPLVMYVDGQCAAEVSKAMTRGVSLFDPRFFNLHVIRNTLKDPNGLNELRACEVRFKGNVKMVTLHDRPLKSEDHASRLVVIQTDGGIDYDVVTQVCRD